MARYLDIATALARQVRSGELPVGAELPTVRGAAEAYDTTSSTVSRAYHHLADHGLIVLSDRRRAHVSTGGIVAAAQLLDGRRDFRLTGSDDPALSLLLDRAGASIHPVRLRGSVPGLRALTGGEADGAAIHLRHRDGSYNASFVRTLLRGRDPHLLHLWRREQGFLVPVGNPLGITRAADLAGRRVAKRTMGAGTRILLEQTLIGAGIQPEHVHGPELHSHLEVALAVAAGIADTAIGVRSAARHFDLDFVPLAWESYDIALPGSALGAARPLIESVREADTQLAIQALGGYDLTATGTLQELAPEHSSDDADKQPIH